MMRTQEHLSHCRLCLDSLRGTRAIDLFKGKNGPNYSIQMELMLNIDLEEKPGWPRSACLDCVIMLKKILKFRCCVLATDTKLRLTCTSPVKEATAPSPIPAVSVDLPAEEEKEDIDLNDWITLDPAEPETNPEFPVVRDESLEEIVESQATVDVHPSAAALVPTEAEYFPDFMDNYDSETDSLSSLEFPPVVEETLQKKSLKRKRPVNMNPSKRKPKPRRLKSDKRSLVRPNGSFLFEDEEALDAVMVEMRIFVCKECGQDCQTLTELRNHVGALHDKNRYNLCCDFPIARTIINIYDHFRLHLDPDAFTCKICPTPRRHAHSEYLTIHMREAHAEGPAEFICSICGLCFKTSQALRNHTNKHKRETCKYCNKELLSGSIAMHIQMQHEVVVNALCDLCGKGFPSVPYLNMHILDHGGPHGGNRKKKPKPRPFEIPSSSSGDVFLGDYFK